MLHLKITSLEGLVWDEEVRQITIDTMMGQITVLPGHDNLIAVLKPGLVKLVPTQPTKERSFQFLTQKEFMVFGIMGGVLKVENNEVQVLTNMVMTDNNDPVEVLENNKQTLKTQLAKTHHDGGQNDQMELEMQKIELALKLEYRKTMK